MLNKNTLGVQKSEAKLEAPVGYLFMHLAKRFDIWWRPRPELYAGVWSVHSAFLFSYACISYAKGQS